MKRRGNGRFVLPLLLALLSALLIVFLVFTVIADDLPVPDETPPDFTDFSKVSERSVPSEQPSGAVSASEASESASSSDGYTDPYADDGEVHEIVLSFVGDCMPSTLNGASYEGTLNYELANREPEWFLHYVEEYFFDDDWTVANCETVLTDRDLPKAAKDHTPAYWYRGPSANAKIFRTSGIDAVSVCNNHSEDYGAEGYADTKKALLANGVAVGEKNSPLYFERYGFRIAVICSFFNNDRQANDTVEQIKNLKEADTADYIIVFFHGGTMYLHQPEEWKKDGAHRMVDAGADLVLGAHPHVLQPIECYHGKQIVYSLGNFFFGGARNSENRTIIYRPHLTVQSGELLTFEEEIIPCYVNYTNDIENPQNWLPAPIFHEGNQQRVLDFLAGKENTPL